MTTLGTAPQDLYYLSWMTQRIANRAPEWTHARKWSWSILQQLLNPIAGDIENVNKQLIEERNNIFTSVADINLADRLYRLELGIGMEFNITAQEDGVDIYNVPNVYAEINDVEQEITIAHKNDIQSLMYTAIPSRVEYGEESFSYSEVIPRTSVSDLAGVTPNDLPIEGHLYITIRGNSTWEYRGRDKIYYPKVYIHGTARKGTVHEEAIPIRYNGTFKTIYQWKSVDEIFISYLDDATEITVEILPFDRDTQLDTYNLFVPASGVESWRFVRLGTKVWGSTLVSEGFTVDNFEAIRLGFNTLDHEYEIELHDTGGSPVDLTAMILKPNTDYMFAVDSDNLYVYTTKLPYPDLTVLEQDSPNTKMDIYSDRWLYARGDTVVIKTDILDITTIPWQFRWTLLEPDGTESYVGVDGSKWPTTTEAWIANGPWERGTWNEQVLELLVEQTGEHMLTLECLYSDESKPNNDYILTTRFLYYVPFALPEITISLPAELKNASNISFDSDGELWFHVNDDIYLGSVFYDYFLADYEKRAIWLRENYTSVRVVI